MLGGKQIPKRNPTIQIVAYILYSFAVIQFLMNAYYGKHLMLLGLEAFSVLVCGVIIFTKKSEVRG